MGGNDTDGFTRFIAEGGNDISRAIQTGFPAERNQLTTEPIGARSLKKRRRWDAAQLDVAIVDPKSLLCKPLQGIRHIRAEDQLSKYFSIECRRLGAQWGLRYSRQRNIPFLQGNVAVFAKF